MHRDRRDGQEKMVSGVMDVAERAAASERYEALNAVSVFFVVFEIGAKAPDSSVVPQGEKFLIWHRLVGNALRSLLKDDRSLAAMLAGKSGKCIVACIVKNGLSDEPIRWPKEHGDIAQLKSEQWFVDTLKKNLKPRLTSALSGRPQIYDVDSRISMRREDSGQPWATVLVLDDLEAARAFVQSYERGETHLPIKDRGTPETQALQEAMESAVAALPKDYAGRRDSLTILSDTVRCQIAVALEPALNHAAKKRPQETYEEKKELAKWVNAELRRFGLALRAPKTGHPCFIVATTGNRPEVGRFVFDYVDENGKRQHPMSSSTLPCLELCLDDLTRAVYGDRVSRKR